MYQRILVPIDGTGPSNSGLMEAIRLAENQGAALRLLHVIKQRVLFPEFCIGTDAGDVVDAIRAAGKAVLDEGAALARQFGLEPESIGVESMDGDAAALIAAHAKTWRADLIVMGTHNRRGLQRIALGSEAAGVVRNTRIPVLLVQGKTDDALQSQSAAASDSMLDPIAHS